MAVLLDVGGGNVWIDWLFCEYRRGSVLSARVSVGFEELLFFHYFANSASVRLGDCQALVCDLLVDILV